MNAGLHEVKDLISNRFEVPIYQRCYSWKRKHIQKLIHDAMAQNDKRHFTGVFFFKTAQNGLDSKKCVIDGQQRLTTIYLIIKALFELKNEYKYTESKILTERTFENVFYNYDNKLNLKLLDNDMEEFKRLFINDSEVYNHSTSLIRPNYNIIKSEIRNLISKNGVQILDDVYKKLMELNICVIEINPNMDEDAQEIFESLNSKNELLTSSALLKNHIFMSTSDKEIDNIFNIWNQIEKNVKDIDDFVPNFIMAKKGKSISHPKNYYQ